jgi:chemotaxis protein MotB
MAGPQARPGASGAKDDGPAPALGTLSISPSEGELQEEGAPAWTTTFGDLMSLLLTFFVLMYSMSELKIERFTDAKISLTEAFQSAALLPPPTPNAPPASVVPLPLSGSPAAMIPGQDDPEDLVLDEARLLALADAYLEQIARQLERLVEENELQHIVSVIRADDGVRLRILSSALFPSGSAVLTEEYRWVLNTLGSITSSLDVPAVVSGHTDDVPIQTAQFLSNWELSAARAAGVARELVEEGHDPTTIRVEGFGEYQPAVPNDSAESRAINRRVEILFNRDAILATIRRWIREGRNLAGLGVDPGSS